MKFLIAFASLFGTFAFAAVLKPTDPLVTLIVRDANVSHPVNGALNLWVTSPERTHFKLPITEYQLNIVHHFIQESFPATDKQPTTNPQFVSTYQVPHSLSSNGNQFNEHSLVVLELWNATQTNDFIGGTIMTVGQLKQTSAHGVHAAQLVDSKSQPAGTINFMWQ